MRGTARNAQGTREALVAHLAILGHYAHTQCIGDDWYLVTDAPRREVSRLATRLGCRVSATRLGFTQAYRI